MVDIVKISWGFWLSTVLGFARQWSCFQLHVWLNFIAHWPLLVATCFDYSIEGICCCDDHFSKSLAIWDLRSKIEDDLDWYVLDQPTQQSEGLVRDPLRNIFIILVVFLESWEGGSISIFITYPLKIFTQMDSPPRIRDWGVTRAAWDLESFTQPDSRGTSGITGARIWGIKPLRGFQKSCCHAILWNQHGT